ncbi:MAG TPA: hypothetical protein VJ981_08295 [Gammaproteobacteria bacterium]|nr:hypothetical protein [Gammaproteobacteria bacterium]
MIRGLLIAISFSLSLFMLSAARADDQDLQQKIETVRSRIEQEETVRNQLREDLASMDEKVDKLKQQLEELEAKLSEKGK